MYKTLKCVLIEQNVNEYHRPMNNLHYLLYCQSIKYPLTVVIVILDVLTLQPTSFFSASASKELGSSAYGVQSLEAIAQTIQAKSGRWCCCWLQTKQTSCPTTTRMIFFVVMRKSIFQRVSGTARNSSTLVLILRSLLLCPLCHHIEFHGKGPSLPQLSSAMQTNKV